MPGLTLQDTNQVWVGHWGERMILHARFREQHGTNEKIAVKNLPARFRESGAENREITADLVKQRIGNRADVPSVGGIKGRAVFEIQMPAACRSQTPRSGKRLPDRFGRLNGAGFECEDNRLGISGLGREFVGFGHTEEHDGA